MIVRLAREFFFYFFFIFTLFETQKLEKKIVLVKQTIISRVKIRGNFFPKSGRGKRIAKWIDDTSLVQVCYFKENKNEWQAN